MSLLEQYRAIKQAKQVQNTNTTIVYGDKPVSEKNVSETEGNGKSFKEALAVFGHESFRDGQEEVVREVLTGKDGVLAVFQTGFGKSLTYQIVPLITGKLTIVVSPLISLMRDQVSKLQKLGINSIFINSTVPINDVKIALMEVQTGSVTLLYVAPERFSNPDFIKIMSGVEIDVLAIDEAHCISRWGHDFRPSYSELGGVIEKLNPRQVIALTATATPAVQQDICRVLGIEKAKRFVQSVWRKNLQFMIFEGVDDRYGEMAKIAKNFQDNGHRTGIVYCPTRKEAESICEYFNRFGVHSEFYHAGLNDSARASVQDTWAKEGGIIVATCAFGMGIDRPDVRFVMHVGLSQSVEDIYQEVGRAGRDGKPAYCISFWDMGDYRTQKFLIDLTNPSAEDVSKFWDWIKMEGSRNAVTGKGFAEISLTQKEMSMRSGCINVGGCISVLKGEGLVQTLGRGKYAVAFEKERKTNAAIQDAARKDKLEHLEKVVEFYRDKDCRMSYLCGYFGDITFSGNCGVCDNCKKEV